jgi:4-alpha-glucanotransferase
MTSLNRKQCHDIDGPVAREWLVTNGLGGYASGTVAGLLNRRYHGLMVVPVHPPLGRYLVFAKADAVAIDDDGSEIPLHSNRWGGGWVEPRGHERLESFRLDRQLPVWRYAVAGRILEQRIWMPQGRHQVSVAYRLVEGDPLRLRVGLIASYRDHHAVNGYPGPTLERTLTGTGLKVALPEDQTLSLASDDGEFSANEDWVDNFFLATEHERGLEDSDRHPRIAYLKLEATTDDWHGVGIALNDRADTAFTASLAREQQRIEDELANALPGVAGGRVPDWIEQLLVASDSYLFRRQGGDGEAKDSVIAGYPWFGDWGRDTMIALPGLTLATGRQALARAILETFAGYVHDGLLPNVFPGAGETPDYNSVDAALWFIEAWRAYLEATHDKAALRRAFPALVRIVAAYRGGTRFGIRIDPSDGLVQAGEPGLQLTWMDARVDGRVITPRHGKPVEINALWYNALRSMAGFARVLGAPAAQFDALADAAQQGFMRYDRGDGGGLFDVLDGPSGDDRSIRPNQVFALSLTHSPIADQDLRRRVLEECRQHLLTPFGLRSLSPEDDLYQSQYLGNVAQRDGSYHQGPVWTWLLGHFAMAEWRVTGAPDPAQQGLAALGEQLSEACVGQLSEIHDGDAPHLPRGAPAQAWSVACTLEAWWRIERARHATASPSNDAKDTA